jgi:ribonucleoside-triphosphate reductase
MSSSEIRIVKREGKREAFSVDKIKNAVAKAFLSVGSFASQEVLVNILSHLSISDGMNGKRSRTKWNLH